MNSGKTKISVISIALFFFMLPCMLKAYQTVGFSYTRDFSDDLEYSSYSAFLMSSSSHDSSGFYFSNEFNFAYDMSSSEIYPERNYKFRNHLNIGDENFITVLDTGYSFEQETLDYDNADIFLLSGYNFYSNSVSKISAGFFYTNSFSLFGVVSGKYPLPIVTYTLMTKHFYMMLGLPGYISYMPSDFFSADFNYFPDRNIISGLNLKFSRSFNIRFQYQIKTEKLHTDEYDFFNNYQEAGMSFKFGFMTFLHLYVGYRYDNSLYTGDDAFDDSDSYFLDESYYISCSLNFHI
ncbi:MAG: hypothetical protein JW982_03120 [Spirochaetes bacterium]|nr:hypothetical protein [Spirochaetota bacterium]